MIEPTPYSPLLRKTGAVLARWALGLTAFAWIVVAVVWGGLHFLIVPRIAEFRPLLESRASSALGLTVHIGAITAQSNGVIPSMELREVSLLDTHNREVLRLPKVVVGLSARSALNRGVEQLYIEGPTLDVRRAPDGQI